MTKPMLPGQLTAFLGVAVGDLSPELHCRCGTFRAPVQAIAPMCDLHTGKPFVVLAYATHPTCNGTHSWELWSEEENQS